MRRVAGGVSDADTTAAGSSSLPADVTLESVRKGPGVLVRKLARGSMPGGGLIGPREAEALRDAGLRVSNAVCVVDREEGGADELARHAVRLRPLFTASELLEA